MSSSVHQLSAWDTLATDIGPVITAEAQATIEKHVAKMRAAGHRVEQVALSGDTANGTFVPPTIVELSDIAELEREVFGPVLHVVRFRRAELDRLIDRINATGYGLTFGLHTRLDETIAHVTSRVKAGNLYINRNVIGAVVGVQPFGGRGLSGTGPKAGGPLYLGRLVAGADLPPPVVSDHADPAARDLAVRLEDDGDFAAAARVRGAIAASMLGAEAELSGPVGERNLYALHPRGRVLVLPQTREGLLEQLGVALAAGNDVVVGDAAGLRDTLAILPPAAAARVHVADKRK